MFIRNIKALSSASLVSVMMLMPTPGYGAQDKEMASFLTKLAVSYIIKQDKVMVNFFNPESNTSYSDLLDAFITNDKEFSDAINNAKSNVSGQLGKRLLEVCEEIRKYFSAAIGVFKQYHGKNADHAFKFKADMDRVFTPEVAFNSISQKLQNLLKEAEALNETETVEAVQMFMSILQKKKEHWLNKSSMKLLSGLTKRMGK